MEQDEASKKMYNLSHLNGKLFDGLEFCSEVYTLFEKIRSEPDGIKKLRLRASPTEKLILEELLPICRYVQKYYRTGRYISVYWIDGNQSYDAKILQKGCYVEHGHYPAQAYLEITSAMHKNEHWTWKLDMSFAPEGISGNKNSKVSSEPVVFTNQEHIEKFAPIVLKQISKKASINYPENTSLVVQCHLNSLYTSDDWELLIDQVTKKLPKHKFQEILMYDSVTGKESII
ncbi:MAG: hypothetical protein PHE73_03105 [Sulfurovaceae bacterium]|nr:hypothetical protein [Sulfurovaceae bacterium]